MKKVLKLVFAFLCITGAAMAQNVKFAHINFEELVKAMPQRDSAEALFQKEYKQAKNLIEEMQVDFNKDYMAASQAVDTLSDLARQMLEEQLAAQQQRIQDYQVAAEQRLSERRTELLQPIWTMAQNAVKTVAEREGYIYVFDVSEGSQVLYHSSKSVDILPLVKKELGIIP